MTYAAQKTRSKEARTETSSDLWLQTVEETTRSWVEACSSLTRAAALAGEAQAEFARQVTSFWLATAPTLMDGRRGSVMGGGLTMAEAQAQWIAEAARDAFSGLDLTRPLPSLPE